MKIGVLALQGDFAEHVSMLKKLGVETAEVRLPEHLKSLDGLIIPGGESTTIGKLAVAYGLMEPLREFGKSRAIWGTCAGAIFLSSDIGRDQPLLGGGLLRDRPRYRGVVQSHRHGTSLPCRLYPRAHHRIGKRKREGVICAGRRAHRRRATGTFAGNLLSP